MHVRLPEYDARMGDPSAARRDQRTRVRRASPPASPPHLEPLLACVIPDGDAARGALTSSLRLVGDWTRLREAALEQGLAPLLYRRLADLGDGALVPAAFMAELRETYRVADQRASRLTGLMLRMLDALSGEGIVAVPYKGPALAQDVYGDVALRQFSDLDILVAARDALRARDILLANGFERVQPRAEVLGDVLLRNEGELGLRRGVDGPLVELHWRIGWRLARVCIPAEEVIVQARTIRVLDREVLAPSIGDQVLVLCVHAAHHAWDKLEMMAAVVAAAARVGAHGWPALLDRSRGFRCQRRVLVGLVLSHETAGLTLPLEVRLRAAADPAVRRLVDEVRDVWRGGAQPHGPRERLRRITWLARTEDSVPAAVRHLATRALTPGPEDWDSLRLPPRLYGLYYLWRPVRLVGKFARLRRNG
jgi:hypothetical protein